MAMRPYILLLLSAPVADDSPRKPLTFPQFVV